MTVERVTRTDARVICCGHTHIADVRDLGRRLIVIQARGGYAFDGTPESELGAADSDGDVVPSAELFRSSYDWQTAAEDVARGLPGDVYRAATICMGRLIR